MCKNTRFSSTSFKFSHLHENPDGSRIRISTLKLLYYTDGYGSHYTEVDETTGARKFISHKEAEAMYRAAEMKQKKLDDEYVSKGIIETQFFQIKPTKYKNVYVVTNHTVWCSEWVGNLA